ncbi:MAG: hypothetical protein ABI183_22445 [Polyangiaceae bacterium]
MGALTLCCLAALGCVDSVSAPATPTDGGATSDSGSTIVDSGVEDSGSIADATDTADADVWNPSKLAGLALWLDAEKGVTGTANVSKWADQSGKGNDFSQAAMGNQPALTPNAVHGHAALQFTANSDSFLAVQPLPATMTFGTGDYEIMEVVAYDNTPANEQSKGYGCLYVTNGTQGIFANNPNVPNGSLYVQMAGTSLASVATTLNDATYHRLGARRKGAVLEARADGVVAMTAISGTQDVTSPSIGAFIGGRILTENANQALNGHIAEVVAVMGTVSDADAALLETYFKTKYGL